VRKSERPTVSKMRAIAPTATVSSGRFSVKIWAMNCTSLASSSCGTYGQETYRWSRGSEEDQGTKVSSSLVGEGTGSVDKSTNTVRLNSRTNKRSSPSGGSRGSLLGLDELLLGVRSLSTVVDVTEDWAEDGKGCSVVEDGTKGNGRWLNRWEV
jgi:hypothetical protein